MSGISAGDACGDIRHESLNRLGDFRTKITEGAAISLYLFFSPFAVTFLIPGRAILFLSRVGRVTEPLQEVDLSEGSRDVDHLKMCFERGWTEPPTERLEEHDQ